MPKATYVLSSNTSDFENWAGQLSGPVDVCYWAENTVFPKTDKPPHTLERQSSLYTLLKRPTSPVTLKWILELDTMGHDCTLGTLDRLQQEDWQIPGQLEIDQDIVWKKA